METNCLRRMEKRYLLNESQLHGLLNGLYSALPPGSSSRYTIYDLYLTPGGNFQSHETGQLSHTDTLRLRSYGIPQPGDCVYLERIMQWSEIACRRRVSMTLREMQAYLNGEDEGVALREQDAVLFGNAPVPEMLIAFERDIYGLDSANAWLTLDRNLRYRTEDLDVCLGGNGERLVPEGYGILSVKGTLPKQLPPLWGALQPISFCKYGYAHIAALRKARKTSLL